MALCALFAVSTAMAQPGRGGGGSGRGGTSGTVGGSGRHSLTVFLLLIPEVQTELGLTDDQKSKVQAAYTQFQQDSQTQMRSIFTKVNPRNMTQDQLTKTLQAAVEKRDKELCDKTNAMTDAILTADQRARAKQLMLQYQGADALLLPDVVAKLKITNNQKSKIQTIIDQHSPQFAPGPGNRGGGLGGGFDRNDRRAQTLKQAVTVLTGNQVVQWDEMTGRKFTFPQNMGTGSRGSGRGTRGSAGGSDTVYVTSDQ